MKPDRFTLISSCIVCISLFFQLGCQEEASNSQKFDEQWYQSIWPQTNPSQAYSRTSQPVPEENYPQAKRTPHIAFKAMSHDFGEIRPGSKYNVCEFVFTNTGDAPLVISEIQTSCNCTPAFLENDKREYAPGESGKVLAGYKDTELGEMIKHIYIASNDPVNPVSELAIKAVVVGAIDCEPKTLNLSLIKENGGCPQIVVKSLDNKPFAITGFQSTGNAITVNFNPGVTATKFILTPSVDMTKLSGSPQGNFRISLSRSDCELVSGTYYSPPRFSASPQRILITSADPKKSVIKTINVISNYDEDFSIDPSLSGKGIVSITDIKPIGSGYQLTVEIDPPAQESSRNRMFSDNISIGLKGIGNIQIPLNGYYPGATVPLSEQSEKCKTCGPVRIDLPSMSKYPR